MSSEQDARYALPGLVGILVVVGAIAVGQLSLEPKRPISKVPFDYSDSTRYRIEARLWQDPFSAIEHFEDSNGGHAESVSPVMQVAAEAIRAKLWSLGDQENHVQRFISCLNNRTKILDGCDRLAWRLRYLSSYIDQSYAKSLITRSLGVSSGSQPGMVAGEDAEKPPEKSKTLTELRDSLTATPENDWRRKCARAADVANYFHCMIVGSLASRDETQRVFGEYRRTLNDAVYRLGRQSLPQDITARIAREAASEEERRILFLGAMLPGGPYADLIERRRSSRYALIAALASKGYYPDDAEHINVWRSPSVDCVFEQQCVVDEAPYEFFKSEGDANEYSSIIVMWLRDEDLGSHAIAKTVRLAYLINEYSRQRYEDLLVDRENSDVQDDWKEELSFAFLGPYSSHLRISSASEEFCRESRSYSNFYSCVDSHNWSVIHDRLKYFNWSATIYDSARTLDSRREKSLHQKTFEERCKIATQISSESIFQTLEDYSYSIRPYISPVDNIHHDAELACELTEEFERRGVRNTFLTDELDTALLIGESDSLYARRLVKNVGEAIQASLGDSVEVQQVTYLRGIDGYLPGDAGKGPNGKAKRSSGQNQIANSFINRTVVEPPAGRSQYDYLRRSAIKLKEQKKSVRLIGVLGSDIYDKLLIMQAFRSEFPHALYFTTDMHAIYLHPDLYPAVKNMIVASSHGLENGLYDKDTSLRRWPPFRDSYQTSIFDATLLALEAGSSTSIDYSGPGTLRHKPRLYEIGHGKYFALQSSKEDVIAVHVSEQRAMWFPIIVFVAIFLIASKLIHQEMKDPRFGARSPSSLRLALGLCPPSYYRIRWAMVLSRATTTIFFSVVVFSLWGAFSIENNFSQTAPTMYPLRGDLLNGLIFCTLVAAVLLFINYSNLVERYVKPEEERGQLTTPSGEFEYLDEQDGTRHVIALAILFMSMLFYFSLWLLPIVLPSMELWSLDAGVSTWPPIALSVLAIALSICTVLYLHKSLDLIAKELEVKFNIPSHRHPVEQKNSFARLRFCAAWTEFLLNQPGRATPKESGTGTKAFFSRLGVFTILALPIGYSDYSYLYSPLLRAETASQHMLFSFFISSLIYLSFAGMCVRLALLSESSRHLIFVFSPESRNDLSINNMFGDDGVDYLIKKSNGESSKWQNSQVYDSVEKQWLPLLPRNVWVDVEFIEDFTKRLQGFYYFPVFVAVILISANLPFFDRWPVSGGLLYIVCAGLAYVVHQAWTVNNTAKDVRSSLMDTLDQAVEILRHSRQENSSDVKAYRYALSRIGKQHEGAFLPLWRSPIFRIVLISLGTIGIVVSQAFFGVGYSY